MEKGLKIWNFLAFFQIFLYHFEQKNYNSGTAGKKPITGFQKTQMMSKKTGFFRTAYAEIAKAQVFSTKTPKKTRPGGS
jgi:hypothetical protein